MIIAIALSLNSMAAPARAATLTANTPIETVPVESATHLDNHKSFFTLSRKALDFSKFAQRSQNKPRKDPHQIISAVRKQHQNASPDISVQKRIQQLKEQLPEQSSQLRSRVSNLSNRVRTSASNAKTSLYSSVDTAAKDYVQTTKLPPIIATLKNRINRIQKALKERVINLLEQTSSQMDKAAEQLKT